MPRSKAQKKIVGPNICKFVTYATDSIQDAENLNLMLTSIKELRDELIFFMENDTGLEVPQDNDFKLNGNLNSKY